jgi:hypothetical protein
MSKEHEKEKPWYECISIRGYTQVRYNRIGATNPRLVNSQGDKSIGDSGGIYIRRARFVFSGDVNRYVAVYFQPDFASAIDDTLNAFVVRDAYADIFLDQERRFRFRVGQSKTPYGWELMQSSGVRAPFDRSDGINSAFVNERDLGVFFYFEMPDVRRRLKRLVDSGLKGSGDYGMTAFGISNGQPPNTRERNDNKHFFTRVAYPFDIGSQTLELAAAAYSGLFVPSRTDGIGGQKEILDARARHVRAVPAAVRPPGRVQLRLGARARRRHDRAPPPRGRLRHGDVAAKDENRRLCAVRPRAPLRRRQEVRDERTAPRRPRAQRRRRVADHAVARADHRAHGQRSDGERRPPARAAAPPPAAVQLLS